MIVGRPRSSGGHRSLSPIVQEVVEVAAVRAGDQFAAALTPWLDHAISADPPLAFGDFADALSDLPRLCRYSIRKPRRIGAPLRKFLDDLGLSCGHSRRSRKIGFARSGRHVRGALLDAAEARRRPPLQTRKRI